MANGFATLGAALGGDSELEYEKGMALGANTQVALAQARERVEKARAQMNLSDQLVAAGIPENVAKASSGALTSGGSLGDVIGILGKQQEQGFRATAADPNVPVSVGNRALMGVASAPVEPNYAVGPHAFANKFTEGPPESLGAQVGGGGTAAQIQMLQAFGFLDPAGRVTPGREADATRFLKQTQKLFDAGGVTYPTELNNPFAGGAPASGARPAGPAPSGAAPLAGPVQPAAGPAPVVPLATTAGNAAAIAGAKKGAEIQSEKAQALPSAMLKLDDFEHNVDNLLAQPGFDKIYGHLVGTDIGQGAVGLMSQEAANAQAALGQIDAQSFGISIQSMRGLGQLSNQEGLKVQKAFALATNPHLSPDAARAAYADMKTHLAELRRVAQVEAGQGGTLAPTGGASPGAPQPGTVEEGYIFQGGDPANPASWKPVQ